MRQRIAVVLLLGAATATRLAAEGGASMSDAPPPGPGAGTGGGPAPAQDNSMAFVMMLVMGFLVLMMFTTVRKQKREERERKAMVDSLKTGAKVVTVGGIHGTVVRKGEESVDIQTGGDGGATITLGLNAIAKVVTDDKKA